VGQKNREIRYGGPTEHRCELQAGSKVQTVTESVEGGSEVVQQVELQRCLGYLTVNASGTPAGDVFDGLINFCVLKSC
jgi:hypothetical protein